MQFLLELAIHIIIILVKILNEILFIDTPYKPHPGSFAKPKEFLEGRYIVGHWLACREIWHYELKDLPLFFYSHEAGKTKNISAFMNKVEDILNLKKRSEFGFTQRKTICWIRPSSWWTKPTMRRSLFTLLLRVSQNYNPEQDNFDQALYSHVYTKDTRVAIIRFLAGYTHCKGKGRGWHNIFKNCSLEEIQNLLIKK